MKIGLIGVGTIGTFLLENINHNQVIPNYEITAVFDEREDAAGKLEKLSKEYRFKVYKNLDDFLASTVDLIIECANIEAVERYAPRIMREKDLFLISVGALVDPLLYEELVTITDTSNTKLYLPSGAVGGLDIIKAASMLGGLDSVTLVTRKPASALDMPAITKEEIIFTGSAKAAIARYPKNANVAIILSMSGIGIDRTKVTMIADPEIDRNMHQIEAVGDFGKLSLTLENNPSPNNPKTSYLTGLSILSSLQSLQSQILIG